MTRSAAGMGIVVAVAVTAAVAGDAAAQDGPPEGRIGIATGVRRNVGELGETFPWGYQLGFEAAYQPGRLGIAWSVMFSWFSTDDAGAADDALRPREMHLGLRLRWPLSDQDVRAIPITLGGTLLRTDIPTPPDAERLYVGPYVGLGYEELLGGFVLAVEARYGMLLAGPAGLSFVLTISRGS